MSDFLAELASSLARAAERPNVHSYKPNSEIHEAFHKSTKVGRILRGGNRSGKSVAGVVESINRATGRNTFQKVHDVPTRGRIVTVDKDNGIEQIIKPLLAQWTPPSELVNGSWEDSFRSHSRLKNIMTFRNGSTIDLKTHQQEIDSFAGVPLHWCWFDEECPQAIFNECRLRLIDYNGVWYMTMTPVEGQDWIFDRFVVTQNKNVDTFEVDIRDNPHLSQQALSLLSEDLTDDEKEVREKGTFVPKGGIILREFKITQHVVKTSRRIPKNWDVYVSIDHGFNNPSAILWHAVSPGGDVVTFYEHYMRKWVIKQHVEKIKAVNKELRVTPIFYVGDPSMAQKNAITGTSALDEYRRHGIPVMSGKRDVSARINKMNEYLKYDKWHIMDCCPNTIREIKGYAFKVFTSPKIADRNNLKEEPNKRNDHAVDSCGYFYNMMPYIVPEKVTTEKKWSLTETNKEDFPWDVDTQLYLPGPDDYAFGEV